MPRDVGLPTSLLCAKPGSCHDLPSDQRKRYPASCRQSCPRDRYSRTSHEQKGILTYFAGGASGIGLAAIQILIAKGAKAFILDLAPPPADAASSATFIECNTASWPDLLTAFKQAGSVDIAIANAGVSEEHDYFEDRLDEAGELLEPTYNVIDVNYRGVLNFVKLATSYMRRQGRGGSIVITSSATAYSPEQSLPVYSATKLAVSIQSRTRNGGDGR